MQPPVAAVREPGPWTHQDVRAAGASFHVATSGAGEHTVLLLHDFPMYWWQWREQLPALGSAGYHTVAMDLRGFGGSDYQPGKVELSRLVTDVSATMQSLGITNYTLVGAGMGGTIGWMAAAQGVPGLHSLVTVGSPHPRLRRVGKMRARRNPFWREPVRGPRSLQDGVLVSDVLTRWSAPENRKRMEQLVGVYSAPMERRFAAESAWETLQGTRKLTGKERKLLARPITVPVLALRGAQDPRYSLLDTKGAQKYVAGQLSCIEVPESGHFVSEEQPGRLTELLLEHVRRIS